MDDHDHECSICLDLTEPASESRLVCGHVFHTDCINRWIASEASCPNCRARVSQAEVIEEEPMEETGSPTIFILVVIAVGTLLAGLLVLVLIMRRH